MTELPQPYEVTATPGWPPVAIPGRPGWWRHCGPNGEQIDLPTNDPRRKNVQQPPAPQGR